MLFGNIAGGEFSFFTNDINAQNNCISSVLFFFGFLFSSCYFYFDLFRLSAKIWSVLR